MKKSLYPIASIIIMIASAFTVIKAQEWKVADNYSVKFDGGDPKGEFSGLKANISFDPNNLGASNLSATIDVATINTGNGMKNGHAKSEMWFNAQKYPTIGFTSKSISKLANGFEAKGTLDMHGVQKDVAIPFTFENNVFHGTLNVNRLDYNVNTAEPNHGSASFKVDITVPVTK